MGGDMVQGTDMGVEEVADEDMESALAMLAWQQENNSLALSHGAFDTDGEEESKGKGAGETPGEGSEESPQAHSTAPPSKPSRNAAAKRRSKKRKSFERSRGSGGAQANGATGGGSAAGAGAVVGKAAKKGSHKRKSSYKKKFKAQLRTGVGSSYEEDLRTYLEMADASKQHKAREYAEDYEDDSEWAEEEESIAESHAFEADFPFTLGGQEEHYVRGCLMAVDEDRMHEFKAVFHSHQPATRIANVGKKYINAFLNTSGGTLYFGVHDDGTVFGISMDRKLRDDVRLRLDGVVNSMRPQVDPGLYQTDFIPVLSAEPKGDCVGQEVLVGRFVVRVRVEQGRAPVYFIGKPTVAFVRRDGGCIQLEPSAIEERLLLGRPLPLRAPAAKPPAPAKKSTNMVLIGREQELQQIVAFVAANAEEPLLLASVYGAAGVGKSSFARRVTLELQSHFPDARYVLDLSDKRGGYLQEEDWLKRIVLLTYPRRQLPDDRVELEALYDSCFRNKRTVLLVENAGREEQVQRLVPNAGMGHCLLLVVSRRRMNLHSSASSVPCESVELMPLSEEDGVQLLFRFVPEDSFATPEDMEVARAIVRACACLPLAIRGVGSAMARARGSQHTPAQLLETLVKEKQSLSVVEASFSAMFELLEEDLRLLSLQSSVFPESFTVLAAMFVLQLDYSDAVQKLDLLVENSLLFYNRREGRYTINELLRAFLREKIRRDNAELWQGLRNRFLDYYLDLFQECVDIVAEKGCKANGSGRMVGEESEVEECERRLLHLLELEMHNFVASVRYGIALRQVPKVEHLVAALDAYRPRLPKTFPTMEELLQLESQQAASQLDEAAADSEETRL